MPTDAEQPWWSTRSPEDRRAAKKRRREWTERLERSSPRPPAENDPTRGTEGYGWFERFTPDGQWKCFFGVTVTDGQLVIGAFGIEAVGGNENTPRLGITSTTLRSIPIGAWLASHRSTLADSLDLTDVPLPEEIGQRIAELVKASKRKNPKRGRAGYPETHYQRIALLYLDLLNKGMTKGILREIARREKRQPETIRDWIHRARQLGFLSPGTPGAAGAEPGPRLFETTKEED